MAESLRTNTTIHTPGVSLMPTIPLADIVDINANVLSAGGAQIDMNSVFITNSTLMTNNQLLSYSNADDVGAFFGLDSVEYNMAVVYFNGYSIAQSRPGLLYFYKVSTVATAAVLSGSTLTLTLAELQALPTALDASALRITVDGVLYVSAAVDFSAATSFSNAAQILQTAFDGESAAPFTVSWNATTSSFVFTSGTTGASSTITFVSATEGTMPDDLGLSSTSTGASITQGVNAITAGSVPATMLTLTDLTRNWATFTYCQELSLSLKEAFADWVSTKNAEFAFLLWTTSDDASDPDATGSIWNYVRDNDLQNVFLIGKQPGISPNLQNHAAFSAGIAASIDFTQTNNRPTFKFKNQAGLTPGVNNQTVKDHLVANGFNFYGIWGENSQDFRFLAPGQVSGPFRWMDSLVNAIYMKRRMQFTLATLLTSVPSIPYNQQGYQGLIAQSLQDDINSFLNYGAIRTGVGPTSTQTAAITFAAGFDISEALFVKGYYLQVKDPGGAARANRTSPAINFWYMDGGSVHEINLTSTMVQ